MSVGSRRVLVVDDDPDILESMQMVLEDFGHQVSTAADGERALEQVRGAGPFDLVLCDVGMPGLDGWQVARQIKAEAPATRVLMLTGIGDQVPSHDPRRAFVDGILCKPIEIDHLERLVAAAPASGSPPSPAS